MRTRNAVTKGYVTILALGLCLAAPRSDARAAPPDRKDAAQKAPKPLAQSLQGQALSEYEGGKLLFTNKDFSNALIKFQHAYELSKDPRLLWNVAVCQKELRRYTRMLATLRQLLDEGGSRLTPQDREDAANAAKAVEAFVSPLKLTVNEPGATVLIDGEQVGTTPIQQQLLVDIGSHEIRVTKPGFKDAVKPVVIAGASDAAIDITLAPDVHRGRLIVVAGPNDLIQVDGRMVGQARWEGSVSSGGHTLRVSAPGMEAYQSEVLVKDNEARRIQITLNPAAANQLTRWFWIAGGAVLLAGAVIGGAVLFQPTSKAIDGTVQPPGKVQLRFGGM